MTNTPQQPGQHGPVVTWLGTLFIVDFATLIGSSIYLGGDALNGKVVDGHYFLGAHGSFREVTHVVYVVSWIIAASTILSFFALVIAGAWARRGVKSRTVNDDRLRGLLFIVLVACVIIAWANAPRVLQILRSF